MFTGLIADLGSVLAVERDGEGATLRVRTALGAELRDGDSIAVDGVCLTATHVRASEPPAPSPGAEQGGAPGAWEPPAQGAGAGRGRAPAGAWEFETQAIHETLARSTLGALARGDLVNLELALRADGRLGGHIVQGHVDGVGTVTEVREDGFSRVVAIDADAALLAFVVAKGSIAIDGVSLTVSALRDGGLEVSLIPETLARTTLGRAASGRQVNLEVDILAKHVQRLLEAQT